MLVDRVLKFGGRPGNVVNIKGLAELFGVGRDAIQSWITQGMPELPQPANSGKRQFDTARCIKWKAQYELDQLKKAYLEHILQESEEDPGKMTKAEAERRKAVAVALTSELELAKSRGEVANIEDLMINFESSLINVRAKLVGLPTRMAGDLAHQDGSVITELLDKEIEEMLTSLSDYDHEFIQVDDD